MTAQRRAPKDPFADGRVLHFVRHGQYYDGEFESGSLTALGRRQAAFVAAHFADVPIDAISSSDTPRAIETADIVAEKLGLEPVVRHRLLREVLPTSVPGVVVPRQKRTEGSQRIERIIDRFFKPSRLARQEVFVCHGNLIRSLVLRVTTGHAEGFHQMLNHHGGVTTFVVVRSGIRVVAFNVQEHVPHRWRSIV